MMIVHHASSLASFVYCIARGQYSNAIIWGLYPSEVSNPFLLFRKNLIADEKLPRTSFVSGGIFSLLFLLMR